MENKPTIDFISDMQKRPHQPESKKAAANTQPERGHIPANRQSTKTKNEKRQTRSSVIFIVLAAFVIFAFSLVAANYDRFISDTADDTSAVNVVEAASGGEGDQLTMQQQSVGSGFPVSFVSNSIKQVEIADSRIFVLNNGMLTCLDHTGREIYSLVLTFIDPIIKTGGGRCIVFDRRGCEYILCGKNDVILRGRTEDEGQIITAAVGKKGSFAVSSRKSGCTSLLTFYDRGGSVKFQWRCADEHISAIAVSDSDKQLICAGINSKQGDIYTRAYYLDINNSENNRDFTIDSNAVMDIFFTSGSELMAVCSGARVKYNFKAKNSTPVNMNYTASIILRANDDDGNTAVITEKVDSFDKYQLSFYDDKNNLKYTIEIDSDVVGMACDKGKTYVLEKDRIVVYKQNGKVKDTLETDPSSVGITVKKGRIYYFSHGYLRCDTRY